jgi:hypothetical protein
MDREWRFSFPGTAFRCTWPKGFTVAVLSNNGDLDTSDLAEEILGLFAGD